MEGNKLIAEFMGGQYVDEHLIEFENFYSIKDIGGEFEYTNCFDSDNELKYHSSWDWLMPVTEKIESLNYDVQIGGGMMARIVDIDLDRTKVMKEIEVSYPTKLETTYKAVVEFIKLKQE